MSNNHLNEYLSLVSKVSAELQSQFGFENASLAEWIINVGRFCDNAGEFNARLTEFGSELPYGATATIFEAIHRVNFAAIHFPAEGSGAKKDQTVEEIDIEINDKLPNFLRRKAEYLTHATPVKVFKDPSGSLSRGAASHSALFESRRERIEQQTAELALPSGSVLAKRPSREGLPIFKVKKEILEAVSQNRVVVLAGEPGSGKTTQLTQYLAEAGYAKIGCSQPRRSAAISAARRVAEDLGCRIGETVGYSVHLEARSGPGTAIEYVTEGELLRRVSMSCYESLAQYSVLVIDEAQERSVTAEVLFALIRGSALHENPSLRLVIVTSDARDSRTFTDYFCGGERGCLVAVPLRTFPVEIVHSEQPVSDYLEAAASKILEIHETEPRGDVLVLLASREEVDFCRQTLRGCAAKDLVLFPVYNAGEAPAASFEQVSPPGKRRVYLANAGPEAASPAKIDGVRYVVDPGFARLRINDPKLATDSIVLAPISQASARRRARLAGRSGPGKCYRLYTERALLEEMSLSPVPEILRISLTDTVLRMSARITYDVLWFSFMDPPPWGVLVPVLRQLYCLGALWEDGLILELGRSMVEFPLDPPWSKALMASVELGCADEVLTVISMSLAGLSWSLFCRPRDDGPDGEADRKRARFFSPDGDHLTLLAVFEAWKAESFSLAWCSENCVRFRSLCRALELRDYLKPIMVRQGLSIASAGGDSTKIRKAITAGLFFHAAKKDQRSDGYRTLIGDQTVHIHPSSALHQRQPSWVVYGELDVNTREREYMRNVTAIDPSWLVELAPRLFKKAGRSKTK